MTFGVERFVRRGDKRREADAAHRAAAGVLKMGDLARRIRLAGAHGRAVQRENVVEDAHEHLQPFGLAAPNFSTSSRSVAFSLSFIFCMNSENSPDFGGHFVGDLLCAPRSFYPSCLGRFPERSPIGSVAEEICAASFSRF